MNQLVTKHSAMNHLANSTLKIATLRVYKTQPKLLFNASIVSVTIVGHLLWDTCNDITLILKT